MGIFKRIRPHLAGQYIGGVSNDDFVQKVSDKCVMTVTNINVSKDGRLEYDGKALTFGKDLLVVLSDDLVGAGYPHTLFVQAGDVLEIKPACWLLMDDESREDLIGMLKGSHSLTLREFRNITI